MEYQSFQDLNRGVLLDLNFLSAPQVAHNLQWEGVWRDLRCLNRATAFAVREHAGHTIKSSLKHILTVDRRNDTIFPSEGSLFRLQQVSEGKNEFSLAMLNNDSRIYESLWLHCLYRLHDALV